MASSQYNKEYYEKNKEKILEKANLKYKENKESMNLNRREWYEKNKEKQLFTQKIWCDKNRHLVNSYAMKRHAAKKQRVPKWLTDDDCWMIEQSYDIAAKRKDKFGFDWHVDHIVPLQGKTVSGLHVPWNLQVIPAVENKRKSNKF